MQIERKDLVLWLMIALLDSKNTQHLWPITVMFVGVPSKGPSQCEPKDPWQIPRNRFCPRRLQDR